MRCDSLGDNPNTSDYVLKQCNSWMKNDFFGWDHKAADWTKMSKDDLKQNINNAHF
jgi:hypothetical protein